MKIALSSLPVIKDNKDLSKRTYIELYFNNKRYKEYTGKSIGFKIFPNRATTSAERTALLKLLAKEILKRLADGTYRQQTEQSNLLVPSLKEALQTALQRKTNAGLLTDVYKRDLISVNDQFLSFLTEAERHDSPSTLNSSRVEQFLVRFNSSKSYYTRKRNDLASLFKEAAIDLIFNPVHSTTFDHTSQREKIVIPFSEEQLARLFNCLQTNYPKLFLCCLISYNCWLKPHTEIRYLTKSNFTDNNTQITLNSLQSRNKDIRVVFVPEQARIVITPLLDSLTDPQNIFTGRLEAPSSDYFVKQWRKMIKSLKNKDGDLVQENQSIFSFLHTAAVQTYNKTRDIERLQASMGHRSIDTTAKYLKGSGDLTMQERIDHAPTLS